MRHSDLTCFGGTIFLNHSMVLASGAGLLPCSARFSLLRMLLVVSVVGLFTSHGGYSLNGQSIRSQWEPREMKTALPSYWSGHSVVHCDNMGAVAVVNSGYSRVPAVMHLLHVRCLFFIRARFNMPSSSAHPWCVQCTGGCSITR